MIELHSLTAINQPHFHLFYILDISRRCHFFKRPSLLNTGSCKLEIPPPYHIAVPYIFWIQNISPSNLAKYFHVLYLLLLKTHRLKQILNIPRKDQNSSSCHFLPPISIFLPGRNYCSNFRMLSCKYPSSPPTLSHSHSQFSNIEK